MQPVVTSNHTPADIEGIVKMVSYIGEAAQDCFLDRKDPLIG